MEDKISGIHHITAIAGQAQRNYDFYTRTLGLRLVKKTVNFDDPGTYHFYYGNEVGSPGTILTFFPWEGIRPGRVGTGMATEIGYSVPKDSFAFWKERFAQQGVLQLNEVSHFGEASFQFRDPDGLLLTMVVPQSGDNRTPWTTETISTDVATRGFHNVVLTLRKMEPTAYILTDVLGYQFQKQEGNRYRFATDAVDSANFIDIVEAPNEQAGINAGGTNHHIAFRTANEEALMAFREKVAASGLNITGKIDRNYFYSLYFREPGGVLFEIATDNPGFAVDEPVAELGTNLKLPAQYEAHRVEIEQSLPVLK
ncbi:glyoxalase family protein [Cnuella takakiae]|uniref:Glyoxalase family protein n=1 Tax=Cnuella takakiae TaxID=1302690 RepID=A0A1M5CRI2_9BACT|nr:ring-cleaving dioxygenase [Cnuella takakiae]OLY94741.1 ring-cleaving dioxygenase [Cnuella takakiae]SHF57323.1 glyoxalase family protein [Cnuella takakiae]